MKNNVVFSDSDVFDEVSDSNKLIKLELLWTCSADTVTDVRCDENVLNFISLC